MLFKKNLKNLLLKTNAFKKFYQNGYLNVGFSTLLVNFIFQRIFRLSADAGFSVHFTSTFLRPQNISYGQGTAKNFARTPGMYVQAGNGIQFGSDILIGPNVAIISANHDLNVRHKWKKEDPIQIGNNVWIAANVVILPGVKLGNNVVVGAGSVVTKSFDDNNIIAGSPAKIIGQLDVKESV